MRAAAHIADACSLDRKTPPAKKKHSIPGPAPLSAAAPAAKAAVQLPPNPNMFQARLCEEKIEKPAVKKLKINNVDVRGMSKLTSFFKPKKK